MSFSRNCILGTGLFFLLTVSCAAVEWHHPLSRDGGGIWRRRIPITVTNPTDRAIKGVPVRIAFGAGGVPLAGMAAESVRACDSRGQELLFALTDSQALPVSRGPIPSAGFLTIPVECEARQSASCYVYFDNPSAGELPDFLTDRSALANGDLKAVAGPLERLEIEQVGTEPPWPAASVHRAEVKVVNLAAGMPVRVHHRHVLISRHWRAGLTARWTVHRCG